MTALGDDRIRVWLFADNARKRYSLQSHVVSFRVCICGACLSLRILLSLDPYLLISPLSHVKTCNYPEKPQNPVCL